MRLLDTYPRTRPALLPRHAAIFEAEYKLNRDGAAPIESVAKRLEAWMHRRIAAVQGNPTLELGAGTLNHLAFERDAADYDIVEPFDKLFAGSSLLARVRRIYSSQHEIHEESVYHRVISVATLEHMENLPAELAKAGLLLRPGGVFQAGIPSEGGFLWWLAWRSTTGVAYWLRNRLDYGVIMRHEHLNTAAEILSLIRYFFEDVRVVRFPTPVHHLSFYVYVEAREPKQTRCADVLRRRG